MKITRRDLFIAAITLCLSVYLVLFEYTTLKKSWVSFYTYTRTAERSSSTHPTHRPLTEDDLGRYSIRITQQEMCSNTVQYSGYVDITDTDDHIFFLFFESQTSPETSPTLLWLNGGPGCSSMIGAWVELGPCLINVSNYLPYNNPYSWNRAANLLFLDQPIGTGYSYGKSKVLGSVMAAQEMYAVLQVFFRAFPKYRETDLHVGGESYGGHYVPALSDIILHNNRHANAQGLMPIQLKSLLIGNGWIDFHTQIGYYETYACSHDSPCKYHPIFDNATCQHMQSTKPECQSWANACHQHPSRWTCYAAGLYCKKAQLDPFDKTGLNPFDIRKKWSEDRPYCYQEYSTLEAWANTDQVRRLLGVDSEAGRFESCGSSLETLFTVSLDSITGFSQSISDALTEGVSVLMFSGDMDWQCNWYGNKALTFSFEWPGKAGYSNAREEKWQPQSTEDIMGYEQSYGGLTFVRLLNAGHMAVFDQPEAGSLLFHQWISSLSLQAEQGKIPSQCYC
ncbi:Alpha/Beta hydrolase protein [Spinellus fusiger]|nr:Alpha/Beta hydrolase protein [Spinellus fusiger]